MKKLGDAATKDGDRLLAQGNLTTAWIEQHRNVLDPSDYRYFYKTMSGAGESPRNPMIYADLRDRSGSGEDVRDEARRALHDGAIRPADYDRILGEVAGQRPGWYKRGSQYISTASGVSEINPDPARAQRKAVMLDDWNDWAAQNPKATEAEAQTAYKNLVNEYALIDQSELTLTKRLPRFLVGDRASMDLNASETATVEAFERGEITREEFERQALLLKDWRDTISRQPPKKKRN